MKNIILQHWTGELSELELLSSANIKKYAQKVGADYRMLRGQVFRKELTPPCQKLYMLDEEFDNYDVVVMLDPDMFTRKGMEDNIFDEVGVGKTTEIQEKLLKKLHMYHKHLANFNYPYWGGAIRRMDKDLRQKLRIHLNDEDWLPISKPYHFEDEGIMHRLMTLADIKNTKTLERKWSHGSFEEGIEKAALIHIRTKIAPQGPKRPKLVNYKDLIERGIIEE